MKDKVKDALEMQWLPAITTMIVLMVTMITCFCWTINRIDQQSARIDQQCVRTDRLYELFIELLKTKRR